MHPAFPTGRRNSGLKGVAMKPYVQSLRIRNFKGIAELDLTLDGSLTVLAGVNGVGKTSVIQAALDAVTQAHRLSGGGGPAFELSGDLIRYGASEGAISAKIALDEGKTYEFAFAVRSTGLAPRFSEELRTALKARFAAAAAKGRRLAVTPLIVFYDQNRIGGLADERGWWPNGPWQQLGRPLYQWRSSTEEPADRVQQSVEDIAEERRRPSERKTNRAQALDTTPYALTDFKAWFFDKEGDEAREARERGDLAYEDPEVQAVQMVMQTVAGEATRLRSRKPEGRMERELYVRQRNGQDVPFEALSGGEQAFFLLAVDLARRLILEFPNRPLNKAPGFVCIDEIELHLHPAWQREILTRLMGLFGECQFLVSTHSPQVLGGVAAEHIRFLKSDEEGRVEVTKPLASKGRDSNYVLEGVLETEEQDPEVDRLFGEFDRLMDAAKFDEADRVLDELDALIEGGSPRITVRRAKCRRRRRMAQ